MFCALLLGYTGERLQDDWSSGLYVYYMSLVVKTNILVSDLV